MHRPDDVFTEKLNNRYFYMSRWCILLIFFAALLGYLGEVLIVYVSVAVHECSHLMMCKRYGIPTKNMIMLPYGMELRLERLVPPDKKIMISLAGPCANLVMFVAGRAILNVCRWEYVSFFTGANFILFLFNLFPCIPLDGGEILRCMLSSRYGILNSYKFISRISRVCGVVLLVSGCFFAVYTGGNITLLVISFPVFVGIAKLKIACIHASWEIFSGGIGGSRYFRLFYASYSSPVAQVLPYIGFGCTVAAAVCCPGEKIVVISQSELLYCMNCKNTYATFGECVEILENM